MRCCPKLSKSTKDIFGTPEPKNISLNHSATVTIQQIPQIAPPHIPKAQMPHPEMPNPEILHPHMPNPQIPDPQMIHPNMPDLQIPDPQMPQTPPKVLHSKKAKEITVVVQMNPLPRTTPLLQSSSHSLTIPDQGFFLQNRKILKAKRRMPDANGQQEPSSQMKSPQISADQQKLFASFKFQTFHKETPVQKCRLLRRLYHYTDKKGYKAILKTRMVKMSTGRDAICGPGVYLTSLPPNGFVTKLEIAENNYANIFARKIKKVLNFFFSLSLQPIFSTLQCTG